MALTPATMRAAVEWLTPIPTNARIDQYLATGFNTILIAEIRYGQQKADFNAIFSGQNGWTQASNPIVTFINYMHSKGKYAGFVMNPNRYGDVFTFMSRPADIAEFKRNVQYLASKGIDFIEIEEPKFKGSTPAAVTAFFKTLRSYLPAPKLFGFNMPSGDPDVWVTWSFDYVTLDRDRVFNMSMPQPGKDATAPYVISNNRIYASWKNMVTLMPNTHCTPCLYKQYGTPAGTTQNVDLVINTQQSVTQGWGVHIWPMDKAMDELLAALKPVLLSGSSPTGTLDLRSTPTGAAIRIKGSDGVWGSYGVTNRTVDLTANTYTIERSLTGYQTDTRTVTVNAGQTVISDVTLQLNAPTTGTLEAISTPSGAQVIKDNTLQGVTPLSKSYFPGSFPVIIRLAGYNDITDTVTISAGVITKKSYSLVALPTKGSLDARSNPSGATIYFDNLIQGLTNVILDNITPGSHVVKLVKEGYKDFVYTVTIVAGETTYINPTLTPSCVPAWACELPLNGYEKDGCGNRRANSVCNPCVPNWACELPLNGYEKDGCGNRRQNTACNPPPVKGMLNVVSVPPGAEVSLNNVVMGNAPFSKELDPDHYAVVAKLAGYPDINDQFDIKAGETLLKVYTFKEEPKSNAGWALPLGLLGVALSLIRK